MVTGHKPSDKRTPDEYIPFLQALFEKFNLDRDEHLKVFMQLADNRGKQIQNNKLTYQDTPALTDGVSVEVEQAGITGDQAVLSAKYSM
jgi:hypothetical protein